MSGPVNGEKNPKKRVTTYKHLKLDCINTTFEMRFAWLCALPSLVILTEILCFNLHAEALNIA